MPEIFSHINVKKYMRKVDWDLLVFLLLFMNVKLVVKLLALIYIYARHFNFSFRFSLKPSGDTWFYPAMILIAVFDYCVFGLYRQPNYVFTLLFGIGLWVACLLALHQIRLAVRQGEAEKLHNAVTLFLLINAAMSFIVLGKIMLETGAVNPYRYQGNYQKYFISTGDYIKGITFDTSTTNAVFNALGVMYFLFRKKYAGVLLCMSVLLLTCSNTTNLLLLACLLYVFIFRSDRDQKSIIVICIVFLALFLTNVTPQNNLYSVNMFERAMGKSTVRKNEERPIRITERPDSTLTAEEKKAKKAQLFLDSIAFQNNASLRAKPFKKTDTIRYPVKINIHAPEYQHRPDSSEGRMQAIVFLQAMEREAGQPVITFDSLQKRETRIGKIVAYKQLFGFLKDHPAYIATGTGAGNFSSKIAFRASGLKIMGGYPAKYVYMSDYFKKNHFTVYLNFFAKDSGYHSIVNLPNSVYAQLMGEYGLLGLSVFFILYLGYFFKRRYSYTYGVPVLLFIAGCLFTDYWFEQLSVIVFFELLLLLDLQTVVKKDE